MRNASLIVALSVREVDHHGSHGRWLQILQFAAKPQSAERAANHQSQAMGAGTVVLAEHG